MRSKRHSVREMGRKRTSALPTIVIMSVILLAILFAGKDFADRFSTIFSPAPSDSAAMKDLPKTLSTGPEADIEEEVDEVESVPKNAGAIVRQAIRTSSRTALQAISRGPDAKP